MSDTNHTTISLVREFIFIFVWFAGMTWGGAVVFGLIVGIAFRLLDTVI